LFSFTASGPFTIRLFNIKGREVRVLENVAGWDGRDQNGQLCEGGLYIYQITAEGRRISGTVVVIEH